MKPRTVAAFAGAVLFVIVSAVATAAIFDMYRRDHERREGDRHVRRVALVRSILDNPDPPPVARAPREEGCTDETDTAVMRVMSGRFRDVDHLFCSVATDLDDAEVAKVTAAATRRAAAMRPWIDALPDRCVRAAYSGWLDYFRGEIDDCVDEMRTHRGRREFAEYLAENAAKDARQDAWDRVHAVPTPPVH